MTQLREHQRVKNNLDLNGFYIIINLRVFVFRLYIYIFIMKSLNVQFHLFLLFKVKIRNLGIFLRILTLGTKIKRTLIFRDYFLEEKKYRNENQNYVNL